MPILLSLSGAALWGLFSLRENLREPELLRSPNAVVVKGCNPIETDEARRMCPQLFALEAAELDSLPAAEDARETSP